MVVMVEGRNGNAFLTRRSTQSSLSPAIKLDNLMTSLEASARENEPYSILIYRLSKNSIAGPNIQNRVPFTRLATQIFLRLSRTYYDSYLSKYSLPLLRDKACNSFKRDSFSPDCQNYHLAFDNIL